VPQVAADRRPAALLLVVAAVVVEALVVLAAALLYLVLLLRSGTVDLLFAALTLVFTAGVGLGLLACVRGLLRGHRWARAPVVTWQLLQGLITAQVVRSEAPIPVALGAAVLLVLSFVVVVALFHSSVVSATGGPQPPPVL
jgi:hypothetical protein